MSTEEKINYADRRKRFMDTFNGDEILTSTLPKLATELFGDEFGCSFSDAVSRIFRWYRLCGQRSGIT